MSDGTQKKGLGPLAWIAIGCGGLIVIGVLVMGGLTWWGYSKAKEVAGDFKSNPGLAAARMAIRVNPDLEEVAVDQDAGTITVRNTKTGEEFTVDWSEVKDGKLRFASGGKEVTVDAQQDGEGGTFKVSGGEDGGFELSTGNAVTEAIPEWVPVLDGSEPTNRHTMRTGDGVNGGFQLTSDRSADEVLSFYRGRLEAAGFTVRVNTFDGGDATGGMVNATDEAGGRNVVVMARAEDGATSVTVSYRQG